MKNMKISQKLAVGFAVVVVFAMAIGIVGFVGMSSLSAAASDMYETKALPLGDLANAMDYYQRLRVQVRNAIMYTGDQEKLATVSSEMDDRISNFEKYMESYSQTIATENGQKLYDAVMDNYAIFKPGILEVLAGAKEGQRAESLLELMAPTTEAANQIAIDLKSLISARMEVMEAASRDNAALTVRLNTIIVIVIVAAVVLSVVFAVFIATSISKPISYIEHLMHDLSVTGSFQSDSHTEMTITNLGMQQDEIGTIANAFKDLMIMMQTKLKTLEEVSTGNLAVDVALCSSKDSYGNAMKQMVDRLNDMFGEINHSTAQVAVGSKQLADGSQVLAQGSTEQASAVEQLSASIHDIADKTRANAEMADKAANLAVTIKHNAETGNRQMNQMMDAVREINAASQSINKVIKVIDDIAFQTNILALNAAVEAARAGQHGKGFAVVAEEVRNLAAKSAEAAKDTGNLIANSMEKAELGAKIAEETAASLTEIVSGINESSQIVSEIAQSSGEQAAGIEQINKGITQVGSVIQQNSATAEESASASEEMSGQAHVLEGLIAQFKLRNNPNAASRYIPDAPARKTLSMPEKGTYAPQSAGDYGKY